MDAVKNPTDDSNTCLRSNTTPQSKLSIPSEEVDKSILESLHTICRCTNVDGEEGEQVFVKFDEFGSLENDPNDEKYVVAILVKNEV